ncbi:MAG: TonB-dependent receptor [Proteobacteria bacterium]|nr:TonB-dependent receptor [Pseudomonadota bacterium]
MVIESSLGAALKRDPLVGFDCDDGRRCGHDARARSRSSLSDVPEHRLDQLPAHDTNALANEMSGVLFSDIGAGRDKAYIRGISDGALTGHAQSTVGVYLDGVRLTYAAPDPQLQLVDVARVDVLRGPQGALYGAGSIGGIISIESNTPDATAAYGSILGGVEVTNGGGLGDNTELMLNLPVVSNRLAIRLAGYDQRIAGWQDNALLGREDTNAVQRIGGRLSAQLDLTENWRLRTFVANQTIDASDAQYLGPTNNGPNRTAHLLEPHDNDFLMMGGAIHGSTRYGVIDTTTAIVRHEVNSRYDATGSFSPLVLDPSAVRPLDDHSGLDILVHETRLTSPAGVAPPWFLGLFYADGDNRSARNLRDGAIGLWPSSAYSEDRRDAVDEVAVFGETSWALAPDLTLSTGLRLFRYHIRVTSKVTQAFPATSSQTQRRLNDSGAAPDIRLAYHPNAQALFYLGASEGYRSAGFNTGAPAGTAFSTTTQPFSRFSGDELWAFEAGTRLALLDGRLLFNAASFYNEWRHLQTDELISNNLPFTGNAGTVGVWGFESDVSYEATNHVGVGAHLLVNEPEISHPDPSFPSMVRGLPGTPELTLSGSLSYERELSVAGVDMTGRAELNLTYVGSSAAAFSSAAQRTSYTRTDASFSLNVRALEFLVYAENIFDIAGTTFSDGNPYSAAGPFVTQLRPFTLGAEIRHRFN